MKVQIDIENSNTKNVSTIETSVIKYEDNSFIFDLNNLSTEEIDLIKDAINIDKPFTDIELFFIDDSDIPYYGNDYKYEIKDNKLYLNYTDKKYIKRVEEKNEDWTINYNEEFNNLVLPFINSDNSYILVYYDNGLKCYMYKDKPNDDIFMNMFFDKGYKSIALFKKKESTDINNIRDNLEFINSYFE